MNHKALIAAVALAAVIAGAFAVIGEGEESEGVSSGENAYGSFTLDAGEIGTVYDSTYTTILVPNSGTAALYTDSDGTNYMAAFSVNVSTITDVITAMGLNSTAVTAVYIYGYTTSLDYQNIATSSSTSSKSVTISPVIMLASNYVEYGSSSTGHGYLYSTSAVAAYIEVVPGGSVGSTGVNMYDSGGSLMYSGDADSVVLLYGTGGTTFYNYVSSTLSDVTYDGSLDTLVESVTISGSSSSKAGSYVTLTATTGPSDAYDRTVSWSASSSYVYITSTSDTTTGGTCRLYAIYAGTYTITATANDGSGVTGTFTLTVADATATLYYNAKGGSGAPSTQTYTTEYAISSAHHTFTVSSTTPTLEGYNFLGWSTTTSATTASYVGGDTISVSINSYMILYAVWEQTSVTSISLSVNYRYVANGYSVTVTAVTSPSDAYDRTVSWSITSGSSYASITSTSDTSTGGTCVITVSDSTSTARTITVRATADDGSGVYNSTNIYKRAASTYLYYDANGGSGAPSTQTITLTQSSSSSKSVTVSSTTPTLEGYNFLGWSASSSATTASYVGGDSISVYYGTNTTLYAVWSEDLTATYDFELTYDANGGSGAPDAQYGSVTTTTGMNTDYGDYTASMDLSQYYDYYYTTILVPNSGTAALYTDSDGTNYMAAFFGVYNCTIETLLEAMGLDDYDTAWAVRIYGYTDSLDYQSIAIDSSTANKAVTISPVIMLASNYVEYGSSTAAHGYIYNSDTAVAYIDVSVATGSVSAYDTDGSLLWTSTWGSVVLLYYTGSSSSPVTYNTVDNTLGDTEYQAAVTYTFTISSTTPTLEGYNFLGWSTSSSATTASYAAGGSITLNAGRAESVTLYAVWGAKTTYTFTIYYDANGGSGAPDTQTVTTYDSKYTFTISSTVPTLDGYDFLGWSTSSSATTATYSAGDTTTLSSSTSSTAGTSVTVYRTLYAVWTDKVYEKFLLTLNANGGSGSSTLSSESYEEGTVSSYTFTIPELDVTRTGYDFLGWAVSSSATTATYSAGDTVTVSTDDTMTDNTPIIYYHVMLYAVWSYSGSGEVEVGASHLFGVIWTEVFMNTYGAVIVDGVIDLNDWFWDYENLRVNFYSFAMYGTSMVINGVEIPVDNGTVTLDDTTYTPQNIYVTYEDGYVYLTFASETGSLTRATVVSLGEEQNRTLEFLGSWYFTTGIWTGATVAQESVEMGWTWSFSATQAVLAFIGVAIVGIIIAYRYTEMTWLDWLVVVIGAVAAFTIVGLLRWRG